MLQMVVELRETVGINSGMLWITYHTMDPPKELATIHIIDSVGKCILKFKKPSSGAQVLHQLQITYSAEGSFN